MDIWDAIRQRRAVRDYRTEAVSEQTLRRLIEAGSWAPSAMNGQPWHFVVVTDPGLLARISASGKRWMLDHDPQAREGNHLRGILGDTQYHLLHGAPALIVIAAPAGDRWGREGCSLAAENIMLAATALGLGTCWIGLAEGWLNSPEGRDALGLSDDMAVVGAITIGYPAVTPPPVARRQPPVTWIGPEDNRMVEDGERAEPLPVSGLYGGLIPK